ncbi:Pentatricopeptide repeat-containing protein, mitochondrial [Capsicum annuum]|uniref:Pentatricopeptide repeat-containing protein, mitochondrial n=1 Tax=Capsicum annuum TaxID=4072 RepID=A0A1U8DW27_CAPAN|nr:pentatricopeptide repeat-containing protein At3g62470, mitochondrial [Capsicum annuum]KAF3666998.1 Pentatricopeptide repeat-containing protein, mitochondrial [Capsicum annuum]KAF3682883.1 Pentatricopeptide repeat-containing protein, mitochondrial [Capsicum annuum]PHT74879.1 Pentatricopeptide repeat-containing protein, mitochondrial [Capsicum annuum]
MSISMRNLEKVSIFKPSARSIPLLNFSGQLFHDGQHQASSLHGRFRRGEKTAFFLVGSSLPLSRLFHSFAYCTIRLSYCQVSSLLPHPTSLFTFQEKLPLSLLPKGCFYFTHIHPDVKCLELNSRQEKLAFSNPRKIWPFSSKGCFYFTGINPNGKFLELSCRGYCSCVDDNGELESDNDVESESDERVESKADPKEVDRVCKVVDELFSLDRNMEAVLDECGVNLSHDLVVDVLERFKHARKPAFRFFCWVAQRPGYAHDSRTYNAMMSILGKTRQFETMVSVLEEMGEKGLLTMETFLISMKAFAAAKERKKAIGMFELMKKYKFKVGVETINCLLDALGRAKLGKEAQLMFEKLEHRFTPNLQTYTVLLNGWCRVKNLMDAGKVWNEMIDKGFKPDIVAHNTMLEGLLKCKKRSDAIKLFEVMKAKGPLPNTRSYTILVRDLCKQGKMNEAVAGFEEMLSSGCEADAATFTCLVTGFGNQKRMDKVFALLREMKEKGYPPDARLYNALIKLIINRRMPDDAVVLYKKMIRNGIQPTIHTYNMLMKSFFITKNYDIAHATWEEMRLRGCCPDENSYTVFIGGLIRQGRSMEACKYLEEMIDKGMKAPQLDYNKFAADFSRAGRPDILDELAKRMKFSGKFEVSSLFARHAEILKSRLKRRDPS